MTREGFKGRLQTKESMVKTVEDRVVDKITQRRSKGLAKYGVTMERTDLSERDWFVHAQEEMLDGAIYLQKLIDIHDERHDDVTITDEQIEEHKERWVEP